VENCFSCEKLVEKDQLIHLDRTPLSDAVELCQDCYDDGITSREMWMMLNHAV